MYKIRFVLFLVVIAGLIGCNTATPVSILPASSQTPTTQATSSPPIPTSTQTPAPPTLTPEPSLRTNGPYFVYFRELNGENQLVMMDTDGEGRKVINLPQEIQELNTKFISPDGNWLAFYTGSAGDFMQIPAPGTADLVLNLLDLETGEIQIVTSLLSGDYPNNFVEAAEKINNQNITAGSLYNAFIGGITRASAWSPDGRYLAFAGQMDGLSSDLYLYDLATKTIRRLSSGDKEMQWIKWSPDGEWILHGSTFEFGMGVMDDIYAASLDGGSVKYLVKASVVGGWLESDMFLVYDNQNIFGDFEFRLIDIKTGAIHKIWDGPVLFYAINPREKKIAVFAHLFGQSPYLSLDPDPDFVPGLYLIDLNTLNSTYIEALNDSSSLYSVSSIGIGENIFALINQGTDQDSYFLSKNGQVSSLGIKGVETIEISPDSSRWVSVTDTGINVYSASNVLTNTIDLPFHDVLSIQRATFVWQADSSGLIIISGTNIYFVSFATGETKLVESNYLDSFLSSDYLWINGQ